MAGLSGEMLVLAGAVILAIIHVLAAGQVRTAQYGTDWNMGARDADMPPLGPLAGRLQRAQANYYETLPLMLALLLAVEVTGRSDMMSGFGAWLWLAMRAVYLPVYAAGIAKVRTLIFAVSLAGIVVVLAALLGR